jgi:hypothetical protein
MFQVEHKLWNTLALTKSAPEIDQFVGANSSTSRARGGGVQRPGLVRDSRSTPSEQLEPDNAHAFGRFSEFLKSRRSPALRLPASSRYSTQTKHFFEGQSESFVAFGLNASSTFVTLLGRYTFSIQVLSELCARNLAAVVHK